VDWAFTIIFGAAAPPFALLLFAAALLEGVVVGLV
jgi:hypothetical protein